MYLDLYELLYILSLEKRPESKLNNKKESSILIEDSYYAMKIDQKMNLEMNIWYYIAMKFDLKINSILEK